MDKPTAEKLNILILQLTASIDDSVAFVRDKDIENIFDYAAYKQISGKTLGNFFELLEKIWERYPDLKPVQMGGTYKIDPEIYEPRFYKNR